MAKEQTEAPKPAITADNFQMVRVGDMTAEQLAKHIEELEEQHRKQMRYLKALYRVLEAGIS